MEDKLYQEKDQISKTLMDEIDINQQCLNEKIELLGYKSQAYELSNKFEECNNEKEEIAR